jgi:gliding motility-associated-like protein
MPERSDKYLKIFLFCILILSGLAGSVFSQGRNIGGIINIYKRVVSIGSSPANNVTVDNTVAINPGDTILLIQMKGVIIRGDESSTYGSYRESSGKPGASEFLIVSSVNTSTKNIVFTNNISANFNASGSVQLIKVPSYNSANVSSLLTCQPWDSISRTGGVLALMVRENLSLNADIDVSGKGFGGGSASVGSGICQLTDISVYDKFGYPDSFVNSGQKGESQVTRVYINATTILPYFPDYARGKGNNFTGGGGGNGRFAGGGGGSNYGIGGKGGRESGTCSPMLSGDGGIGGRAVDVTTDLGGGLFLGSGGGSSTFENGSTSSSGGKGGGIVIIISDTIRGNGRSIKADGTFPVTTVSGNAGAGGGGAGGSIALWQRSFSDNGLSISVSGAKGGNTSNIFGEGGGGGGGVITISNSTIPANVATAATGGTGGTRAGGTTSGTNGSAGKTVVNFVPVLSGFMFNTIVSTSSHEEIDSVCSNMIPPRIKGSNPAGGTPPYTYKWEKSYNKNFLSPVLLSNDPDPVNFIPKTDESSATNDTVWFRRTITDVILNKDVSNPVIFVIQQAIRNNNIVDTPDTICFNSDPPLLQQAIPDLVVPSTSTLHFNWQSSLNSGSAWGSSLSSSKTYDPPARLKVTTWYRRTVSSGQCIDSSSVVKFAVLPEIKNNVTGISEVCYNSQPVLLKGDPPDYGTNKYAFIWQDSLSVIGWKNIVPGGTSVDYTFSPLNSTSYRRLVFLGNGGLCKDTSRVLAVNVNPLPTAAIVRTADTSICEGSKVSLKIRLTGKALWELAYNENQTGSPTIRIARTDTTIFAIPSIGSVSALVKYSLKSVRDGNGCQPVALQDTLEATVYKVPVAYAGPDAAICGPVAKLQASPGIGTGKWYLPSGAVISATDDPTATVTIDTEYAGGTLIDKFVWELTNWQCRNKDTVAIKFDKQVGQVNAGKDTTTYSFDNIITLSATPLKQWESGKWSVITGTGEFDNSEKSSTFVTDLTTGANTFKWTVTNGNCHGEDQINLLVHEEFIPEAFSPNNDDFNNTFVISGLDLPNQTAELRILNSAGNEVFTTSNSKGNKWVDWDGNNLKGNALPEGTYYYFLRVASKLTGQIFKRSGFVLLKRY